MKEIKRKGVKLFKLTLTLLVIALIAFLVYQNKETIYGAYEGSNASYEAPQATTTPEQKESTSTKGVDEVMSRADFKKQQRLKAQEIYLDERKTELTENYNKEIKEIEAELEQVRQGEMSL